MNDDLLERLRTFVSEVGDISRDHERGYGGTYSRQYYEEREEMAWVRLHELADEGSSLMLELETFLKSQQGS